MKKQSADIKLEKRKCGVHVDIFHIFKSNRMKSIAANSFVLHWHVNFSLNQLTFNHFDFVSHCNPFLMIKNHP